VDSVEITFQKRFKCEGHSWPSLTAAYDENVLRTTNYIDQIVKSSAIHYGCRLDASHASIENCSRVGSYIAVLWSIAHTLVLCETNEFRHRTMHCCNRLIYA
jgi:hypothetical protein